MKRRKLFQTCMACFLGTSMLMTSIPAYAEEFSDSAQEASIQAEDTEAAVDMQDIEAAVDTQDTEVAVDPEFTEDAEEEAFGSGEEDVFAASAGVAVNKTNFPDAAFREYVLTKDTNGDKTLSSAELAAVTELNVSGLGIKNLKGIENFTKLSAVNVSKNNLTTLDLSKCTALATVVCSNNSLTKLTMPAKKNLKKLEYMDVSNNKFTSQANAGLSTISNTDLPNLEQINASNNAITSFNCSGFEGILDLSNNKITTLTGGDEDYQATAIYLEGSGNTLSKTSKVDFSPIYVRTPEAFSCNPAVKNKIVMVAPRLSAKVSSDVTKVNVSFGSSSDDASYVLSRRAGNGSFQQVGSWSASEIDDPEFGDDGYVDTNVTAGTTYTYRLQVTVRVQDRNRMPVSWSATKDVKVKVVPGKPSITVKSKKTKTATISWKAVSGADGYQVYMGTSKSKLPTRVTAGTTKTSVTRKNLTKGKTYYFRARAYKLVNGKKKYGSWSSVKSVKVK